MMVCENDLHIPPKLFFFFFFPEVISTAGKPPKLILLRGREASALLEDGNICNTGGLLY